MYRFFPHVLFITYDERFASTMKETEISFRSKEGKEIIYKLDSVILRDRRQNHFSSYITCNGEEYAFDGESFSRMEKFKWKSKLNRDIDFLFAEQFQDTLFNFKNGYQILIYYRHV